MRLSWVAAVAMTFLAGAAGFSAEPENAAQYWPQWRGPLGTGVSPTATSPTEWSESKNVRWKVPLLGHGHSTPIVWDRMVFVTLAEPIGAALPPRYSGAPGAHDNSPVTHQQRFAVLALSRTTGDVVWERTVSRTLPHEGGHVTGSLASNSPATDGERIYAFFGSRGLFALDFFGKVLWKQSFGEMQTKHGHGEGSSPALWGDSLVVNWDHEGDSFIAALDTKTGNIRWRSERNEVTSWSSPIIVEHEGRQQVVVCGTDRVRGYDLVSGKVIWECGGMSANIVASPVSADGMVYAGSSYDTKAMLAINLTGAAGDITGSENVVWSRRERTPYIPSLLLYEDGLYFLRHYQGVLTRVVAKTGEEPTGPFRLPGMDDIYASPVAADGRIYITDRSGVTLVMTSDEQPQSVAFNRLDDSFSASPVLVGSEIILRGQRFLYCIADE